MTGIPGVPSGVLNQGTGAAPDAGDAGAGEAAHTKSVAQSMASLIASQAADPTPQAFEQASRELAQSTPAADATPVAAAPVTEAEPTAAEEIAAETGAPIEDVEKILSELGVDLGLTRADVPPELLPVYERLVGIAADQAQAALTDQLAASDIKRQYAAFAERINKEPDKVLMTLAITKPEIFEKVVEVFSRMQSDPQYKDLVIRELQADAKLQEADRREAMMGEQTSRMAARQVIAAVKQATRKHGVNYTLAEKVVALEVTARGGRLAPSEVDAIVADLRPKGPIVRKPVSIAAPKPTQTAPSAPVAAAAAAGVPSVSPGLESAVGQRGRGGEFRNLIKESFARIKSAATNQ